MRVDDDDDDNDKPIGRTTSGFAQDLSTSGLSITGRALVVALATGALVLTNAGEEIGSGTDETVVFIESVDGYSVESVGEAGDTGWGDRSTIEETVTESEIKVARASTQLALSTVTTEIADELVMVCGVQKTANSSKTCLEYSVVPLALRSSACRHVYNKHTNTLRTLSRKLPIDRRSRQE